MSRGKGSPTHEIGSVLATEGVRDVPEAGEERGEEEEKVAVAENALGNEEDLGDEACKAGHLSEGAGDGLRSSLEGGSRAEEARMSNDALTLEWDDHGPGRTKARVASCHGRRRWPLSSTTIVVRQQLRWARNMAWPGPG